MTIVEEKTIEESIDLLSDKDKYHQFFEETINQNQGLVAYLSAEGFNILTEEEKDLLWYCTLVILQSWKKITGGFPPISNNEIEDAEEANYNIVGEKQLKFKEVADLLFQDCEQEDLLAFVEDTLEPDVEDFITPVGRKVIFISLKTIIDVLKVNTL